MEYAENSIDSEGGSGTYLDIRRKMTYVFSYELEGMATEFSILAYN